MIINTIGYVIFGNMIDYEVILD